MTFKKRVTLRIAGVLAFALVLGGVVMLLWNAVVPQVLPGGRSIDYLHALGLLVLSRILIGGLPGRGGWHARREWARMEAMTPEERERFRQHFKSGRGPRRGEA